MFFQFLIIFVGGVFVLILIIRMINTVGDMFFHEASNSRDNRDDAIAKLNIAIMLSPSHADAYWLRGMLLAIKQDTQSSLSDLRIAAKLYKKQGNENDYKKALDSIQTAESRINGGKLQYRESASTTNLKSKGQSLPYHSVVKVKARPTFVVVELTENMVNKLFCLNPMFSRGKVTLSQTSNFGTAQVMYAGNSFTAKASDKSSILFEGRGFYIDSDIFNNHVESFTNALKNGGLNSFNLMDGKSSDVYGFVSPSNFGNQSLLDVHGATLLTTLDKSKPNNEQVIARSLVHDNSNELLAAILINNFGEGILGDLSNKVDVLKNYKSGVLKGKYGSYLRQLLMTQLLSSGDSENKFNTSQLRIFLEDNRLIKEISLAFNDSEGNLGELLNSYIDNAVGKTYDPSKELDVNDISVKRAALIIAAIDIFGQLKNQANSILFPSTWTLKTKNQDGTYKSDFLTPQGLSVDNLTEVLVMMGAIERDFFRGLSYQEKARHISNIDILLTQGHGFALATSQCYLN